ncbi:MULTISPECIES: hypothetical protein [Parafrankia]|uniref:hypothetical protein n=1 Tax=Parafrankia TaxID=2994362 RepID=UPI001A97D2A2|nr:MULTISPECIES: hypothetical protein [Parafrankia]
MGGLGKKIVDAAVPRDRDVEPGYVSSVATVVQFLAAGLDVVVVRDDHPRRGQRRLGPVELTDERLTGVLLLLGGGPPGERDPDLVVQ